MAGNNWQYMPESEYNSWQVEAFRKKGQVAVFRRLGQKMIDNMPPPEAPPEEPPETLPGPGISSSVTSPTVQLRGTAPDETTTSSIGPAQWEGYGYSGTPMTSGGHFIGDRAFSPKPPDPVLPEYQPEPTQSAISAGWYQQRYGQSAMHRRQETEDIGSFLQGVKDWQESAAEENARLALAISDPKAQVSFLGMPVPKGLDIPLVGAGIYPGGEAAGAISRVPSAARTASALARGVRATETATGPADEAMRKLSVLVRAAEPVREETEVLKSAELGRRVAASAAILERGDDARQAFRQARGAMKGELPKAQFAPPEADLTPQEINSLFQRIRQSDAPHLTKKDTAESLEKVMLGEIPTRGEIALLDEMLGPQLAKALLSRRPFGTKLWENVREAINLPRTLLASWDVSAPLRQGAILAPSHPREWLGGIGPMFKALASEDYAQVIDDAIRSGKYANLRERSGLYLAPRTQATARAAEREEQFMSKFAQFIPGIRQSERAYVSYLNKLRADVFDNIVAGWEGTGKTMNDYERLASFINAATGRGGLGPLEGAGDILSAGFFAPRYRMSRIQVWGSLFSDSPAARKEAAKSLVSFVGTGVGILSLLKLSGLADVEADPRSSDFGKIRVGPVRMDFWASEQQLARLVANLITGQKKTLSGKVMEQNRLETLGRYTETALSPQTSLGLDWLRGHDYLGEELTLPKEARNRLTPLAIQDITEAAEEYGTTGFVLGAAAFAGASVQTIPESPSAKIAKAKDQAAQDAYGKSWDNLSPKEQLQLTGARQEIAQAERAAAQERELTPQTYPTKDAVQAAKVIESRLSKTVLQEMDRLGVRVGPIDRTLGAQGYYLPDSKWAQYQDSLATAWNTAIPLAVEAATGLPLEDRATVMQDAKSFSAKAVREAILSDKPMTPDQITSTSQEAATAAGLMAQYRQMPRFIVSMPKEDEKAIVEAINRIRERERLLPPGMSNKRTMAILQEMQAARTDEDKQALSSAMTILKNPKFYNPQRRMFWSQNPILQKYFGSVELDYGE